MSRAARAAASGGRGPWASWAWWRLFAAAERGDPAARAGVALVAGTPGHRRGDRAREAVAAWWTESRDPAMRWAVLETGAVGACEPARSLTLALLGRLGTDLSPYEVNRVPGLLADVDPGVREGAVGFCLEASGAMLQALWAVAAESPLWRLLRRNGTPPPGHALNALWDEWVREPSEPLWEALVRWGRPATGGVVEALSVIALEDDLGAPMADARFRQAFITALTLGDHPLCGIAEKKAGRLLDLEFAEEICARAMERPGLVWFCKKHRLAPKDQVRRALFFLLTGQAEQHRALDPDGSLLSLAYTSASDDQRARAREAMLTEGDLDLVRVIVGDDRRARIPDMPPEEVRYLAGQLAARRDWDGLWGLVQDVPVETGVDLFRLFDGWTPRDDDGRRLFEMYVETDPATVATALAHLRPDWQPVVLQARFLFHGRVNDVSFAPDGPFLAAAGTNKVAGVFDLRTAKLVERYEGFNSSVGRVLHIGGGTLVAGERTNRVDRECRVLRCADGDVRTLHTTPGSITSLTARSGDGAFAGGTRSGELLLGSPGGEAVEARPVGALGMGRGRWPRSVAAHTESGRLAVVGRRLVVFDPATSRGPAVPEEARTAARAAFVDADTLVYADLSGNVTRLRWDGGVPQPPLRARIPGLGGLVAPSGTGEPMLVDQSGDLHFLDPLTLAATGGHRAPSRRAPTSLTVSPGGDFLAVGDAAGHTDLYDLRVRQVPRIVRRPVVDLVPKHLGIARTALADPAASAEARALLRLLHACLEHRFRFDVEIGDAVALAAGEHDISL
ncbi:WD40 repeat domain-containing protein [Actinomadura syzygii]|uniref:WD40 repeat domain-containing protein n=1 Tax=Actinomadura syzygii TaxID=1427538 RepID=A0A5D0UI25_9ACTN|nr:hypothetical protein [Actinomadura syzygii]TYC17694.1 hypothetical protein FXF65_06870 [Actinomadura syzygii]